MRMKQAKAKVLRIVKLIFIIAIVLSLNGASFATDASNNPKYIGIIELRSKTNMGYAIGNPNGGVATNRAAKIWNLVEYDGEEAQTYKEENIYCLKAEVGFENLAKKSKYDVFYDMKKEKDEIEKQNDILEKLVTGEIETSSGTTISQYNAILAALDMFYYDGLSSETERETLLNNAIKRKIYIRFN